MSERQSVTAISKNFQCTEPTSSGRRRSQCGSVQHYLHIKNSRIIKDLNKYFYIAIKHRHPWSCLVLDIVYTNYNDFSKDEILLQMNKFKEIFKGLKFKKFWKRLNSQGYCEFGLKWGERYDRLSLVYFSRIYFALVQDFLESKKNFQELDVVKINVEQIWIIFGNDDEMFFNYLLKRMELEEYPALNDLQCLKRYDVSLIMDLIMSEETEFLEFFLKYMIKALKESKEFLKEIKIHKILDMFHGVCRALRTLQHVIVFNTQPLRRRIIMVLNMLEKESTKSY